MTDKRESTDAFGQMADELRLQAWLARAEFKNPSLNDPDTRSEVDAMAALRDELRLQLHLGRMEVRDEWQRMEDRWRRLKHAANLAADDAGDTIKELLDGLRDGYRKLLKDNADPV
jgi:hypothetical protein